jgi:hypothetical protein
MCAAALALAAAPTVSAALTAQDAREIDSVAALDRAVLNNFMGLVPGSPRRYAAGAWYEPGSDCFWCLDAAATAAAVLSRERTPADTRLLSVARATLNREIDRCQRRDGSWDETGIVTGFVAVELGTSYLELADVLDPATRTKWARAIRRAADFIVSSKNLTWYTNGNVNLRNAAVMWLAWQITGRSTYKAAYEYEWRFALSPPQWRWRGFGLRLTRRPHRPDGADGAGYLAESDGGRPGFDPEYTMTQLDGATGMWVLSHDRRWLRLMNLFFNQLRPRLSRSFTLDARRGARHDHMIPFYSAGLAVLYYSGDRPDLRHLVPGDLARLRAEYSNPGNFTSQNFYRGLSGWLSMIVLDRQHPSGLARIPQRLDWALPRGPGAGGALSCRSPGPTRDARALRASASRAASPGGGPPPPRAFRPSRASRPTPSKTKPFPTAALPPEAAPKDATPSHPGRAYAPSARRATWSHVNCSRTRSRAPADIRSQTPSSSHRTRSRSRSAAASPAGTT